MLHQYEKDSQHYRAIANAAYQVEKYATKVSDLYKDDLFSNKELQYRKDCLMKWFNELNDLLQSM